MRKNIFFIAVVMFFLSCNTEKKNIIVYYSHSGNTEKLALELNKHISADILSLSLENEYPADFNEIIKQCKSEMETDSFPKLLNGTIDLEKYDTIYLGYPIWFGTYARPITTFLRMNDMLSGHVIVPFATYGSGGLRNSIKELKKACPNAQVVSSDLGISGKRIDMIPEIVDEYIHPQQLCGGYTAEREPTGDEIEMLKKLIDSRMNLSPISVKTQVVAGTNYIFICKDNNKDDNKDIEVKVFQPLPGNGEPELIYIER